MDGFEFAQSLVNPTLAKPGAGGTTQAALPMAMPFVGRGKPQTSAAADDGIHLYGDLEKDTAAALGLGGMSVWDAGAAIIGMAGGTDVEKRMLETSGGVKEWLKQNMSPQGLASINKQFLVSLAGDKSALKDPYALYLNAIQQVPNLLTLFAPATGAARVAQAAKALPGAVNAVRATGFAVTGAGLSGGQSAAEAVTEVRGGTPETNPEIKKFMAEGQSLDQARESAAGQARGPAFAISAAAGALGGPIEGTFLRRGAERIAATAGRTLRQRAAAAGTTAAAATGFEAGQEAAEQIGSETGKSMGGAGFSLGNVGEAAAAGGTIGLGASVLANVAGDAQHSRARVQAARDAALVPPPIVPGSGAAPPTPAGPAMPITPPPGPGTPFPTARGPFDIPTGDDKKRAEAAARDQKELDTKAERTAKRVERLKEAEANALKKAETAKARFDSLSPKSSRGGIMHRDYRDALARHKEAQASRIAAETTAAQAADRAKRGPATVISTEARLGSGATLPVATPTPNPVLKPVSTTPFGLSDRPAAEVAAAAAATPTSKPPGPSGGTPSSPPPTTPQTPATPPADPTLATMWKSAAGAIGQNLRERLYAEYSGKASSIDPRAAKLAREEPGMDKETFIRRYEELAAQPTAVVPVTKAAARKTRKSEKLTEAVDPNVTTPVAKTAEGAAVTTSDVASPPAPSATPTSASSSPTPITPAVTQSASPLPATRGRRRTTVTGQVQVAPVSNEAPGLQGPSPASPPPAGTPAPAAQTSGTPPVAPETPPTEGPSSVTGVPDKAQRQASNEPVGTPAPSPEQVEQQKKEAEKAEGIVARRSAVETSLQMPLEQVPEGTPDPAPLLGVTSTYDPVTNTYQVVRDDGSITSEPFPLPASAGGLKNVNDFLGKAFDQLRKQPEGMSVSSLSGLLQRALVPYSGKTNKAGHAYSELLSYLTKAVSPNLPIKMATLPPGTLGTYNTETKTITLDPVQIPADWRLKVLLHELAHAATFDTLNANTKKSDNLRTRLDLLRGGAANHFAKGGTAEGNMIADSLKAMTTEEFAAHIYSDPKVRSDLQGLRFGGDVSFWKRFTQWLSEALGMGDSGSEMLTEVLDFQRWFPGGAEAQASLIDSTRHLPEGPATGLTRDLTWTVFPDLARRIGLPVGPELDAKVSSLMHPRVGTGTRDARHGWSSRSSNALSWWYRLYSIEQLGDRMAGDLERKSQTLVGAGEKEPKVDAGTALRQYIAANDAEEWRTNELLAKSNAVYQHAEDYRVDDPTNTQKLEEMEQIATLSQLHPNLPFNHPRQGDAVNKAGARRKHANLQARWNALPAEAKGIYLARSEVDEQLSKLLVHSIRRNALAQYLRYKDTSGATRTTPIPLSDAQAVADTELAGIEAAGDAAAVKAAIKAKPYDRRLKKAVAELRWDAMLQGPYRRQERPGTHSVIAGSDQWEKKIYSKPAWDNLDDPNLQTRQNSVKFDSAANTITAEVRRYYVETAFSETEAREIADALRRDPSFAGMLVNYQQNSPADNETKLLGTGSAEIAGLIDDATAGLSDKEKQIVRNNLIEEFADRTAQGSPVRSRVHRENVPGASKNSSMAQLRGHSMLASFISKLENNALQVEALDQLELNDRAARAKGEHGLANQVYNVHAAIQEHRNKKATSIEGTGWEWVANKGSRLSAFAFLTNFATIAVNLLQPIQYGGAHLMGYYDPASIGTELAKAASQLGGNAITSMGRQYRRGLALKRTSQIGPEYERMIGNAASPDEKRMLAELDRRGVLNSQQVNEIMQFSRPDPKKPVTFLQRVEDMAYVAVRQGEIFNRTMSALATYRLGRKNGGLTHEQAVEQTYTMVRQSQFNYSKHNKGAFYLTPALQPFLVFKNFAQHSYTFLFSRMYDAVKGHTRQERVVAQRQLAAFAVMTFVLAGMKGSTPEPIWAAWVLWCKVMGWGDPEGLLREGAASLVGAENAQTLVRGPAQHLGIDLSSRVGIHQSWVPDDVLNADDPQKMTEAMMIALTGAPGALVSDMLGGAYEAYQGDVIKGLTKVLPFRLVTNPLTAYNWATHGYTDSKGNPKLTPEQIGVSGALTKAIGFTPTAVSEVQAKGRATAIEAEVSTARRAEVYDRFYKATHAKDPNAVAKARATLQAYNREHPEDRITSAQLRSSLKQRIKQQRERARTGTVIPNRRARRFEDQIAELYGTP